MGDNCVQNVKHGFFLITVLIIILSLYFGLVRQAGRWLVKEDDSVNADAMVVLMGGITDRVLQAADLYQQGHIQLVILVEESMGSLEIFEERGVNIISSTKQVFKILVELGVREDNILILPGDAVSTQMEATIIRKHLENIHYIDTLLLVTSAEHTRRASMIFRSAFKRTELPVTVLCSPSEYSDYDAKDWWRRKEDIQKVILEYLKIANFLIIDKGEL